MKVTPSLVMYIAAAQIVLTTIGFILYKRPYLWAWEALEHYSENYCGDELDRAQNRFHNLESAKHRARIANELAKYQQECHQDYLEVFTDKFYDQCMANSKSAFVMIPIVSSFLIIGIVLCLHWAPFHKRTLKKPGFMLAFLLSLVLVAVNIGQIITIIVPLINKNASPDHNFNDLDPQDRTFFMKCGYGAETTALLLMLSTCILSALIAFFIIKLYILRIKGQEENLKKGKLRMETLEEYEHQKHIKKKLKEDKKRDKNKHYASTLSSVHEDEDDSASDGDFAAGMGHQRMPVAGGSVGKNTKLERQDSGWGTSPTRLTGHSTPQRGKY